jgi:copper chaperone
VATASYSIVGMTCDHCVNAVRSEIARIEGVTKVDVDLSSGQVSVESAAPLDAATVTAAVHEAGYTVDP